MSLFGRVSYWVYATARTVFVGRSTLQILTIHTASGCETMLECSPASPPARNISFLPFFPSPLPDSRPGGGSSSSFAAHFLPPSPSRWASSLAPCNVTTHSPHHSPSPAQSSSRFK